MTLVLTILEEIAAERRRQIEMEGWSLVHDDEQTDESLAAAAACYALPPEMYNLIEIDLWPWRGKVNRKDRRRDLIRAASLIVAEIERIDRTRR